MRNTVKMLVPMIAAALILSIPSTAFAEETVCRRSLGAITVDNLRVPQGAVCTLTGTRVQGTVKVEQDATLNARRIRVVGNVQAENARNVVVRDRSVIGGSVQIVQGEAARIVGNRITHDLLFDSQEGALAANTNRIGGNLQAFQNTGGIEIRRNAIDGNLQCKANEPTPTGGGNVVQGVKEDQCANL